MPRRTACVKARRPAPGGAVCISRGAMNEGLRPSRIARRRTGPSSSGCATEARAALAPAGRAITDCGRADRWTIRARRRRRVACGRIASSTGGAPMSPPAASASATQSAIQAASRKPRLRPCAPIGGMTCTASPRERCDFVPPLGDRPDNGKTPRCPISPTEPSSPCSRSSSAVRKAVSSTPTSSCATAGAPPRRGSMCGPAMARPERSGGTVELGRDAVVRALVREGAGHRALLVGPCAHGDFGCPAAQRLAAVGADDQPRRDCAAITELQLDAVGRDDDLIHARIDQRQSGQLDALPAQSLDQRRVRHIVAEALQTGLGGGESHLRRAQQRFHVVDDADAENGSPARR